MSNKKTLQGHNKALESLATIAGIPIKVDPTTIMQKFGYTKMAVDTFTPTGNFSGTKNVPHSLGEKPKMVLICSDVSSVNYTTPIYFMLKKQTDETTSSYDFATGGGFCYVGVKTQVRGCSTSSDAYLYADKFHMDNSIYHGSSYTQIYWIAGVTYTIYTFA